MNKLRATLIGKKQEIFEVISESNDEKNSKSHLYNKFMLVLITANFILLFIDTFNIWNPDIRKFFYIVDISTVLIFSIEYCLRLWTADLLYPSKSYKGAVIKYMTSFMGIIDLVAIMPFYLQMFMNVRISVLRLTRVLRLVKVLHKTNNSLTDIYETISKKKDELKSSIVVILLLMLIVSFLMYEIECVAQPDVFTNIFASMWWYISTITTVGYGDIYPITAWGRILSAIIALLGIGLVAIPTGIISSAFVERFEQKRDIEDAKKKKNYCPHCGEKLY